MSPTLRNLLPHLIGYAILLAVTFLFFSPIVFEGKVIQQSDNIQSRGMQEEQRDFEAKTGHYTLWTNAMFSGMPGYQIMYDSKTAFKIPFRAALLGNNMAPPHTGILLMMAGMYFLLVVLRIDWRIALIGAVGFGLSTHFMDQALAGHSTKIVALAYMGPIFAGAIMAFRGKPVTGAGIMGLAMGLQLFANHVQITYYSLLMLGILGLVYLVDFIQKKKILEFGKVAALLVVAAGLAFASNTGRLWTTYEYSQESIRGKSELTQKESSSGSKAGEGGLSKEYAFQWSYGVMETFTLLAPSYMGFSSSENFVTDRGSATLAALQRLGDQEQANSLVNAASHYWGDQPFTGAPMYLGAVLVLLFFLGAYLVKSPLRIWLLIATALTIMMGWGKHFPAFNYFLFDNLPMYNKFRAVTMVYGVTSAVVVVLGMLGLQAFFDPTVKKEEKTKGLYFAGGVTIGLLALAWILSWGLDYGTADAGLPEPVAQALIQDRSALLTADLFRTLLFVAIGFGLLFARLRANWQSMLVVGGLGLLVLADMWSTGKRVIKPEAFVDRIQTQQFTAPQPADEQILQDKSLHYRVADFRRSPFNDALTSYHHKSAGGYHAAKLMRYQELIEAYLGDPARYMHVYGMLNAKYLIVPNGQVQPNPEALGNAWFVKSYEILPGGDAEMAALATLRPGEQAVLQEKYRPQLEGLNIQYDSAASIELTYYHPDTMVYRYSAQSEQLAVFSEIFYPEEKGWSLYIDGERAPILKADFLLRAAVLPAGQDREVKMIFAPKSYYQGEAVTLGASLATLALALFGAWLFFGKYQLPSPSRLPGEAPKAAEGKRAPGSSVRKKK
jgi:hypothetical protein